jgi:hypothetical protein
LTGTGEDLKIVYEATLDMMPIHELFAKKGKGLKNWAKAAGLNPMEDLKNISLNGVPLGDLYIGEVDFSGSDLTATGISSQTQGYKTAIFTGAIFRDQPSLDPDVIALNRRLRDAPDASTAKRIFDTRPTHVFPDVITYTTLIRKSRTVADMTDWLNRMKQAGVAPNAHTFTTILNRTETLAEAEAWINRMEQAGVAPDAVTQSTLEKIKSRSSGQSSSET